MRKLAGKQKIQPENERKGEFTNECKREYMSDGFITRINLKK
jgi:hypothetical protein